MGILTVQLVYAEMFINQSSPLFAITEKNNRGKEFDDFDFMGDGVVYFDKKQKDELDPYPTHYIHIQKIRLTKVNEIPQTFIFSDIMVCI